MTTTKLMMFSNFYNSACVCVAFTNEKKKQNEKKNENTKNKLSNKSSMKFHWQRRRGNVTIVKVNKSASSQNLSKSHALSFASQCSHWNIKCETKWWKWIQSKRCPFSLPLFVCVCGLNCQNCWRIWAHNANPEESISTSFMNKTVKSTRAQKRAKRMFFYFFHFLLENIFAVHSKRANDEGAQWAHSCLSKLAYISF